MEGGPYRSRGPRVAASREPLARLERLSLAWQGSVLATVVVVIWGWGADLDYGQNVLWVALLPFALLSCRAPYLETRLDKALRLALGGWVLVAFVALLRWTDWTVATLVFGPALATARASSLARAVNATRAWRGWLACAGTSLVLLLLLQLQRWYQPTIGLPDFAYAIAPLAAMAVVPFLALTARTGRALCPQLVENHQSSARGNSVVATFESGATWVLPPVGKLRRFADLEEANDYLSATHSAAPDLGEKTGAKPVWTELWLMGALVAAPGIYLGHAWGTDRPPTLTTPPKAARTQSALLNLQHAQVGAERTLDLTRQIYRRIDAGYYPDALVERLRLVRIELGPIDLTPGDRLGLPAKTPRRLFEYSVVLQNISSQKSALVDLLTARRSALVEFAEQNMIALGSRTLTVTRLPKSHPLFAVSRSIYRLHVLLCGHSPATGREVGGRGVLTAGDQLILDFRRLSKGKKDRRRYAPRRVGPDHL